MLRPYFVVVQEMFVKAGLTAVRRVRLVCSSEMHDRPRHFAGTTEDGLEIHVAPVMAEIDEQAVLGITAHEFGHATDFLYPGEFVVGKGEERIVRRVRDEVPDKQWLRWQRAWQGRSPDVVEKTADLIAASVWGSPIGYVGPCLLQSFEGGVPRPLGLR